MCNFGSSKSFAPTNQMTTQTTTASPEAQQMYNTAWQQALSASQRPFQQYSTDPNAFVAGLNPVQTGAISGLQSLSQSGQPYFGAAPGLTYGAGTTSSAGLAGAYMNPFMEQVAAPVLQQQGQQLAQQQAEAIKSGAFGGERAGLQRQALRGQQNLGLGQIYAGGYQQALGAAQADLARQLQAGQALSPMGLQALQSTLQAGTLGQQTEQAGKQALYNQFLMQQAYPFQTAQFLTSAATGLGPGYGGTTQGYQQTQTPLSFWGNPLSDPDLKVGADGDSEPEVIGETYDGQKIYRYRLINPDTGELGPPQIGLMADEAGERNPEAVGDYKGFKTLDYAAATDDAARMGGGVTGSGDYYRGGRTGYALEGGVGDLSDLLKSQEESFKAKETPKGLYGAVEAAPIQAAKIDSPSLKFAEAPKGEGGTLSQGIQGLSSLVSSGKGLYDVGKGLLSSSGDKGDSGIDWMSLGSSALKALPGLASAAAMFSDPNLKTGVRPGYQTVGGVPETTEEETVDDDGFSQAVKETFKYEGGLNPNDVGRGPSMYGINQAAHPGMDVTKLSPAQAQDIYRKQYWEGVGASKLDPQIREMVYDTAVLAGPRRAKQLLEVAGSDPEAYMAAREKFLSNLAANDPQKFNESIQSSWANRNKELRERAGLGNADEVLANLPSGANKWSANTEGLKPAAGPEGLSGFIRGKPAEGLGEKALDFATSEKFLIPLLQGLGGMASSGSRFFAPSLLQGIGAGAKGYADLRQQEFERAKAAEALGLEAKKVGVEQQKADVALRELQRKQKEASDIAKLIAKKGTPYAPTTGADGAPKTDLQKRIAEAEADAQKFEAAAATATDNETMLKYQQMSQAAQKQASDLSQQSPEFLEKTEGAKLKAKRYAEQEGAIQQSGLEAPDRISKLELAKNTLNDAGVYTGPGAEHFLKVKEAVTALGFPGLEQGTANTELFRSMVNKMVQDSTPSGSLGGGISNTDARFLKEAQASLGSTKEGNKKIIDMAIKMEKRKQEIAELQEKYGSVDANFSKHLREWANAHPLFTEADLPPKAPKETQPEEKAPVSAIETLRKRYPQYTEDDLRSMYEKMKKGRQ